ncbi:hypothetical protein THERMOT_246 [Bathymodiolus thermophilus thioautotrophic gill symbiont]|uniref:DUF3846 domain-containing protein n=1 Tax=Bathymodiolus thermophilus thioautotrophic gill symbiont TaxID=2360 RepID=UPI00192C60F3|nr:hypothetical protein [Bathymodiolus thermophilus thioautotrophic gill symbiont]CAB5495122.1 hypothetical protein THERMOT_246 [Bathymodiolus thermophilus thioautotrophic gill symbiont]
MSTIKYKWHEAMLYKVTGDPISIKPTDDKEEFETSELQTFIEGYLGFIKQVNGMLVINDDGEALGLPQNEMAGKNGYALFGNVIFVPIDNDKSTLEVTTH